MGAKLDPATLHKVDGRLEGLLRLLKRNAPYGKVAAAVRQIITDYEAGGFRAGKLFMSGWAEFWQEEEAIWNYVSEVEDISKEEVQSFDRIHQEMIRFVLDASNPFRKNKYKRQLLDAVCDYLACRGYDVSLGLAEKEEEIGKPPASPSEDEEPENRYARLGELKRAVRKAYYSFLYAEAKNEKRLEDREAYGWLHEHGIDADEEESRELADYELPAFDTWSRYLREARQATGAEEHTITKLEAETPSFDRDSGQWVRNKLAAQIEGVETETLKRYRTAGISNSDGTLGRDPDGRVWRRPGRPHSHPWYLRSTLKAAHK